MLCLAIFLLQSTLTHTQTTKRYVTYFWKTTGEFDKVEDYWNHGPIYIPGLQKVFTGSTTPVDVFPPWLKRSTVTTTAGGTKQDVSIITTPPFTTYTIGYTTENPPDLVTTTAKVAPTTKYTIITTTPLTTKPVESEEEEGTYPFSAFLRKLFLTLSLKRLTELPPMINHFIIHLRTILDDLQPHLDKVVVEFVKDFIRSIRDSTGSEGMRAKCYEYYQKLSNRDTLEPDIDGFLGLLDDIFDVSEEEFMQDILRDIKKFPNSVRPAQNISYDILDNLVVVPINRIAGTPKGKALLLMMIDIVQKRKSGTIPSFRRRGDYYKNSNSDMDDTFRPTKTRDNYNTYANSEIDGIYRRGVSPKININRLETKKKHVHKLHKKGGRTDNIKKFTQTIYESILNNMKDIREFMDKVVVSSSETNEYELTGSDESEDKVKSKLKERDIKFRLNKAEEEDTAYKDLHELGNEKFTKQRQKYDKAHSDEKGLRSKKETILLPKLSLTKLIKDRLFEFVDGRQTSSYIISRTTYRKNEKKKLLPSPSH
ncbi:uncharacterized protein LOC125239550 isoform X1 [Leguminivora glycinivorella]|uniref:uncharacterized protein LOC125239550 isoform X1 n=1 Tax=Leguminivora glycinivorella TaxID=1035111 RepID=UPI00200D7772|nr:uncharacterized protein LOC125239550 isoform X1 [Leguminivora glycinivorella]